MATKKAPASKKKKSTTQKTTKSVKSLKKVDVAPAVAKETSTVNMSVQEKLSALKPSALIAEFIGTFVLAGAVINLATYGFSGLIGIALILSVLVIVLGIISGAHLNPAITIAQYVNRKIDGVKTAFYVVAQVFGALAAMLILSGLFSANYDFKNELMTAISQATGVSQEEIVEAGGVETFLEENYQMTVSDAAEQLGISEETPSLIEPISLNEGKEWVVFFTELVAAIVFGLGVGYAVFSKDKNQIAAGLAVGVGLLGGLAIGGASAILNPAVGGAIQAFAWVNPFTAGAMTFWWPVFIYIGATTVGLTIGITTYRFVLKEALEKKA